LVHAETDIKHRVKSGAKGIGRFALNRLGRKVEMITFSKEGEGIGYKWSVDWSKFDKAETLSDIKATVDVCQTDEAYAAFEEYGLDKLPIATLLSLIMPGGQVSGIRNQ
jgi:hypothetical protein